MPNLRRTATHATVLCLLTIGPAGCGALGVIANAAPRAPVPAEYTLAGQSAGVMVWCDRGLRTDWPNLQLDVGAGVLSRLKDTAALNEKKELAGTTYPVSAESVLKWQKDHPAYQSLPIEQIAPRLGVSRLIYIEIEHLSTRTAYTIALYRGTARASLKVVEISNGQAIVAYEKGDIEVTFPRHVTEDGPEIL